MRGEDPIRYTPKGLAWGMEWGSLRHTANAAHIALLYAKAIRSAHAPSSNVDLEHLDTESNLESIVESGIDIGAHNIDAVHVATLICASCGGLSYVCLSHVQPPVAKSKPSNINHSIAGHKLVCCI